MRPNLGVVAAGLMLFAAIQVSAEELDKKYAFVQALFPGVEVTDIRPSPIDGVLEVSVGADIYYLSEDGKYFLQGEIMDLSTRKNLTAKRRTAARSTFLKRLNTDTAVTFEAEDEKYRVLVFTDIDCPYCRKLHRQMDGYNELGITVQYLAFPRKGPGTESWAKAAAVWCSATPQEALTQAKNGENVEGEECVPSPVARHYKLGKDLGISGTPSIFSESGQMIVGYRSAEELEKILAAEEISDEAEEDAPGS
jgi:thiol:disulfide interchange protein DsbC